MLKKINVRDARLGMYLQEISGSWMDHPFWKKSFALTDPKDLKSLTECGIQEVWIDTDKGLDIESEAAGLSVAEAQQKIDSKLQEAAQSTTKFISRVSVQQELEQARKTHGKAKEAVSLMFQEARMGKAGLLHDVGKMMIPDEVLNKPGRLTDEEFMLVKNHPLPGWEILQGSEGVCEMICLTQSTDSILNMPKTPENGDFISRNLPEYKSQRFIQYHRRQHV
jgi:Domain of unknown function (DUF3391)/HD domain